MDITKAFTAIRSSVAAPVLQNVRVREAAYGVQLKKIDNPLTIAQSVFTGSLMKGIEITSGHVSIDIQNTIVSSTTRGDGMTLKRVTPDPRDLCSILEGTASFPLRLKATGKSNTRIECLKVNSLMQKFSA